MGDKDEETKGKKKRGRKPTASLKHTCDTSVEPEIGPQRKKKKQAIQPNQKIECCGVHHNYQKNKGALVNATYEICSYCNVFKYCDDCFDNHPQDFFRHERICKGKMKEKIPEAAAAKQTTSD